jgi:5-methylthioadenosine/S-adenosylhomocysteine deaminase
MDCDLIITNGTVVPMAAGSSPIADGAVAARDGRIVAVGPAAELLSDVPTAEVVDAQGGLIIPGMVNTHTHLAMVLMRGFADDLPLQAWLEERIWPAERSIMNAETVRIGTQLAAAESLKAGVTCACDMYFFADDVVEAATAAGMRLVVSESIIDFPTPSCPTPQDALARQRELLQRLGDNALVEPAVAAHAPYSVCAANLVAAAELAEEFSAPLQIHVAETRWEVETSLKERGATPVAYLADLGVLSERTIAAHCVHVSEADLEILAEFDVGVASNPVSNLKLASGIAPLPQMLAKGIKVGLGTDGAASNNTLDLLLTGQIASLLYKGLTGDAACLPAGTLFSLLTLGGARVLGLADRIGSLEVGKRADVVCLALDEPHTSPLYEPLTHLAYAARAADVRHVVVDGQVVVRKGKVVNLDEADVRRQAAEIALRLAKLAP